MSKQISGMVAVFVADGRVIAHAADFAPDRPGGFTTAEAQIHRVKQRLACAVIGELSSPRLTNNLDSYDCERLLTKVTGTVHLIPVLAPTESGAPHHDVG